MTWFVIFTYISVVFFGIGAFIWFTVVMTNWVADHFGETPAIIFLILTVISMVTTIAWLLNKLGVDKI